MAGRLNGKIALITGGSSGIGLATAVLFVAEGASVIITGRDQQKLDEAVKNIGTQAHAIKSDVTKLTDLEALANEVKARYGHLDIVFANAGGVRIAPIEDITEEMYDQVVDTNLKGTFFTIQKMMPLIRAHGSIILSGATIANQGIRGLSLNSAAKAAVRSLARTLTVELQDKNIRVNVLSPGTVATSLLGAAEITPEKAGEITRGATVIPMGRMGTAEEVANAALFLASDESGFVTGIDLAVDGGQGQI